MCVLIILTKSITTTKSTLLHIYETLGKQGMAPIGEAVRDVLITRELEYIYERRLELFIYLSKQVPWTK